MQIYSMLASTFTVLSFLAFIGIVLWAYGKGRQNAFEEAALAPFAIPDDGELQRADPHPRPSPGGRGDIRESLCDFQRNGMRS